MSREEIIASLKPLIAQARREGKWLWCSYQDIWQSPEQLEAANREGRFLWGAANWKLRDPAEYVQEAQRRAETSQAEYARRLKEVGGAA